MLVTTRSTPIRCAAMKVRPTPTIAGDAEPDPPRGPVAAARRAPAPGRATAAAAPGPASRPSAGVEAEPAREPLAGASPARGPRSRARRRRSTSAATARPGVALRRRARRRAHAREPLGRTAQRLQLLGEPLRVGGRDQDAVLAVGDHVGVAGDVRGEHRGAGGERLGEDHAEALARQRRGAEQVGLVQAAPELVAVDPAERVDPLPATPGRRGSGRPRRASAPITVSRASSCSTSASNAVSSTGRPLRSSGPADEDQPQLRRRAASGPPAGRRRRRRSGSRRRCRRTSAGRSRPRPRRRRSGRRAG